MSLTFALIVGIGGSGVVTVGDELFLTLKFVLSFVVVLVVIVVDAQRHFFYGLARAINST